jgi:hypothetical protein
VAFVRTCGIWGPRLSQGILLYRVNQRIRFEPVHTPAYVKWAGALFRSSSQRRIHRLERCSSSSICSSLCAADGHDLPLSDRRVGGPAGSSCDPAHSASLICCVRVKLSDPKIYGVRRNTRNGLTLASSFQAQREKVMRIRTSIEAFGATIAFLAFGGSALA